jgi:crotonobetainyl-CoA:carnitine CoA-transferase CaiB-like acyl-CoA transferase
MHRSEDLKGILVVALEQAVAGPLASCRLADAGARVIKIEPPRGDLARGYDRLVHGESAYFVWLNRGKESIALDLRDPAERGLLEAMIARADVFLHNTAPGVLAKLGLDAGRLRVRHPRLIVCTISGYGPSGPYSQRKSYDLLVQAESGLANLTGVPEAPGRVGVSVSDIAAGENAASAILRALFARERTGQGRTIDISLFQATAEWMNVPWMQHAYGGVTPQRVGLSHPTVAPYGVFACAGGEAVLISVQTEQEWQALARDVLGSDSLADDPRFAGNPNRIVHRAALDGAIQAILSTRTRADWVKQLDRARIAFGTLSSLDDLTDHPQVWWRDVETPAGSVRVLAPAALFDGANPVSGRVPSHDEHGALIRREFARHPTLADA